MADEFRESGEGTLLPLWKFSYEKAKRLQVTGISWSQSQPDMFVCSFASFSFGNQYSDGMVVVFSIRNTAYPEQVWSSDNKGPMSVDIHPSENCLIAIGLSDGNVMVLNLKRDESNEPRTDILMNIPTELKHGDAVWHIQWENNVDKNPSFYSTSLDGKIISWTIGIQDIKGYGGLDGVEVANLCSNTNPTIEGPDGQTYKLHGCARCLTFHPKEKTVYLIGSVEGNIYLCSSLYSSKFIQVYHGHFLPVAALQWNYYHSNIFISCSEDWTIKIWDRCYKNPLYVFEIGVPIFDVCWAQYSSTVFAAISEDGKVIVYDLNVNKEKPICEQQIVTRKKVNPMRIQINPYHPILIVGDDKGHLNVLKMSPNLRILPKDPRGNLIEGNLRINFELNKMGKLLSFVHDPNAVKEEKPKLSSE